MRVLFTGGGGAGTEALWRLLGNGYEVHFADADISRIHPSVPSARCHQVPLASSPNFVEALATLVLDERIDVLVPGVDEELPYLADAREALQPTLVILPETHFVRTMLDKATMIDWMNSAGLDHPSTGSLAELLDSPILPLVVKPRQGRGSRGLSYVDSPQELAHIRDRAGLSADDYVWQERLIGPEYSVQVVADPQGRISGVIPARIIEKRGITIHAVSDDTHAVIAACHRIHQAWPTQGVYNVQGVLVADRGFVPFEINPRVSTTLCLALAAGADVIGAARGAESTITFRPGVELRRYWVNSFSSGDLEMQR